METEQTDARDSAFGLYMVGAPFDTWAGLCSPDWIFCFLPAIPPCKFRDITVRDPALGLST
jgi:hypothetical protein